VIRGGIPIYGSLIGLELFLFLCERDLQGEPIPLKDLYLALGRSHGGVRRLVRHLERDRWIRLENSGQDRRTHFVVPSARLRKAFATFTAP
jgi:DNA-binding MarR family transcriptional regulator